MINGIRSLNLINSTTTTTTLNSILMIQNSSSRKTTRTGHYVSRSGSYFYSKFFTWRILSLCIICYCLKLTSCVLLVDESIADESLILSESRNLTVQLNETIQLPCLVKKSPNTIVIWSQCEDANCNQVRNPLTINKENFIPDLRFRILSENLVNSTKNSEDSDSVSQGQVNYEINNNNNNPYKLAGPTTSTPEYTNSENDEKSNINSWTLEIRKFSKHDEACYQCQLNTYKTKTIHYCIKLQKKVIAKPKKLTVQLDDPIKLKCHSDENVRMSSIKWYKNNHRLSEESHPNLIIEKKPTNEFIYTILTIKHATLSDAGTYSCRFDKLHDKIVVDVVVGDKTVLKSAEKSSQARSSNPERSYPEDGSEVFSSMSPSFSNSLFSLSKATNTNKQRYTQLAHLLINLLLIQLTRQLLFN